MPLEGVRVDRPNGPFALPMWPTGLQAICKLDLPGCPYDGGHRPRCLERAEQTRQKYPHIVKAAFGGSCGPGRGGAPRPLSHPDPLRPGSAQGAVALDAVDGPAAHTYVARLVPAFRLLKRFLAHLEGSTNRSYLRKRRTRHVASTIKSPCTKTQGCSNDGSEDGGEFAGLCTPRSRDRTDPAGVAERR